jgi:hypothetical protein
MDGNEKHREAEDLYLQYQFNETVNVIRKCGLRKKDEKEEEENNTILLNSCVLCKGIIIILLCDSIIIGIDCLISN